jgi:hypothetical protein
MHYILQQTTTDSAVVSYASRDSEVTGKFSENIVADVVWALAYRVISTQCQSETVAE